MRSPEDIIGESPVCPSSDEETKSRSLSNEEVNFLRDDFINAAIRAKKSGYDGIEIWASNIPKQQKIISQALKMFDMKAIFLCGSNPNLPFEKSLEEYNLQFLNEDSLELIELYLSIVEMEYFPMETNIIGVKKDENFYVDDFEITYVVGCDDQLL
mgnify:CR=1 FL=1